MYQETSKPRTLAESKMIQAFGVPLLNTDTDGGPRNEQSGKILGKSDSMKSTLFYKELWVHKSNCETTTMLSLPVNFQGI